MKITHNKATNLRQEYKFSAPSFFSTNTILWISLRKIRYLPHLYRKYKLLLTLICPTMYALVFQLTFSNFSTAVVQWPSTTKCTTSLYTYFIICFKLYFTRCLSFFSDILILVNSRKQQQEQKYKIKVLDLDLFSVPKKKMHQGCRHMKTCQSDVIALQEKHFLSK